MISIHVIVEDGLNYNSLILSLNMGIQQLWFRNGSIAYVAITLLSRKIKQCSGIRNLVIESELFNFNTLFL
jgi:hypothetical protein